MGVAARSPESHNESAASGAGKRLRLTSDFKLDFLASFEETWSLLVWSVMIIGIELGEASLRSPNG